MKGRKRGNGTGGVRIDLAVAIALYAVACNAGEQARQNGYPVNAQVSSEEEMQPALLCDRQEDSTSSNKNPAHEEEAAIEPSANSYLVIGATPSQETLIRAQIRVMAPEVLPLRIIFVPHWKYVDNARILRLHVPTGYTSAMFTHLPSRTIFIDNNRYLGEAWLGHWIAHELGHLTKNNAREDDAEKAASQLRKRLKSAAQRGDL